MITVSGNPNPNPTTKLWIWQPKLHIYHHFKDPHVRTSTWGLQCFPNFPGEFQEVSGGEWKERKGEGRNGRDGRVEEKTTKIIWQQRNTPKQQTGNLNHIIPSSEVLFRFRVLWDNLAFFLKVHTSFTSAIVKHFRLYLKRTWTMW